LGEATFDTRVRPSEQDVRKKQKSEDLMNDEVDNIVVRNVE
jgi:hypothetical protein